MLPQVDDLSDYFGGLIPTDKRVLCMFEMVESMFADFGFYDTATSTVDARLAFFVCKYTDCPVAHETCYHSAGMIQEKYCLVAEYTDKPNDRLFPKVDFHQRDGLLRVLTHLYLFVRMFL